ncbi:hypothetical protein MWU76_11725 [Gelidibacter sp. F2691]|nr:hypothetical protein [Gelidibacter sp. F2691]
MNTTQNMDHENLEPKYDSSFEDRWETIRKDYRKQYPTITDDDVNYRTGEFDMLTQNIARRTNRSREQVSEEIKNWQL